MPKIDATFAEHAGQHEVRWGLKRVEEEGLTAEACEKRQIAAWPASSTYVP